MTWSRTFCGWGVSGLVDEVVLIVSEIYTNAIEHAPPGPITLRLRLAGRCLGGDIRDPGPLFVPQQRVLEDLECGRGLRIVAALSSHWGMDPQPDGGKGVWFVRRW
ncbi:ATP-binding protein [Sphaerisporangium aureirubrum]|uniref:ATP-binding protein n=1 Tax=Sphaerisporangium aureirubrum TaxID=1544736 RepID=A0ABW1NH91_9ACTN